MRKLHMTLENGLKIYQVQLVGGPCDGMTLLASHDTAMADGNKYVRNPKDDLFYYQQQPGATSK